MRQYRKVSFESHSQISLEITPKVARTTAYSASGATSEEVLQTSHATHATRVNISQETRWANTSAHDQSDGEDHVGPKAHHSSFDDD